MLSHPVWLAGFRPFFILTLICGTLLPMLWLLQFSGKLTLASPVPANLWHAHEMFYGFGWALMGGFLLTASKNWLKIRGYHGGALLYLVVCWLLDRAALSLGANWPEWLLILTQNLFICSVVSMLLFHLLRYRQQDSFADNLYFWLALPCFIPAKNLLLDPAQFQAGLLMTLGLFRLVFLIMLERTLSGFMKNSLGITLPRHPWLDHSIKSLALALVFSPWLSQTLALVIGGALVVLLSLRWLLWSPHKAMQKLELAVMYLGYLAIILQLLSQLLPATPWLSNSLSLHIFTLGCMGLIIPAMIIRISNGHTGHKVRFLLSDKLALWVMLSAMLLRILGPQLSDEYIFWLYASAGCWLLAFSLLGWRYIPQLLKPRIDGKIH